MNLRLLACNVFQREACACLAGTPNLVDAAFVELGEHEHPATLRAHLQEAIDAASAGAPRPYDAILLLFGLCGNATAGLQARSVPLVLPRAHDCATVLLGSRAAFREHFADNPSRPFGCAGYFERGFDQTHTRPDPCDPVSGATYAQYVKEYGEDNARYIWESLHPPQPDEGRSVYIRLPESDASGLAARFRARAEAAGRTYAELSGSLRLIRGLLDGPWPDEEYLTVLPGRKTAGVYDWDRVIAAV
jgi:hypothetical protein